MGGKNRRRPGFLDKRETEALFEEVMKDQLFIDEMVDRISRCISGDEGAEGNSEAKEKDAIPHSQEEGADPEEDTEDQEEKG